MKSIDLKIEDNSAWIWFHDPKNLNTLDEESVDRLGEILPQVVADTSLRSVVFATSAKNFSVGLDLKEAGKKTPEALHAIAGKVVKVFSLVSQIKVPTLALYRGLTVGGAVELTAACDFRFAAPNAKIMVPGVKIGIFNPALTLYYLPRLIGLARTTELALTGKAIDANKALDWSLVNALYDEDALEEAGRSWAREMGSFDPVGLRLNKELLRASLDLDRESFQDLENSLLEPCFKRQTVVGLIDAFLK